MIDQSATGQFGKNNLGDRNEFLPTVHGLRLLFGNTKLYHFIDNFTLPRFDAEHYALAFPSNLPSHLVLNTDPKCAALIARHFRFRLKRNGARRVT